jgi:hypothetical protein
MLDFNSLESYRWYYVSFIQERVVRRIFFTKIDKKNNRIAYCIIADGGEIKTYAHLISQIVFTMVRFFETEQEAKLFLL